MILPVGPLGDPPISGRRLRWTIVLFASITLVWHLVNLVLEPHSQEPFCASMAAAAACEKDSSMAHPSVRFRRLYQYREVDIR
jgi:hypothetical protein